MAFVTVIEASNSMADRLVEMVKPRPPSLGGKDKRSRSRSPGGALPVRDGIRFDLIMSSMGVKICLCLEQSWQGKSIGEPHCE